MLQHLSTVHAGDLTRSSRMEEYIRTFEWISTLPHPIKIITGGNHDHFLDLLNDYPNQKESILTKAKMSGIIYLEHEAYQLPESMGAHKMFVSPYSPTHLWGAFMLDDLKALWESIPLDTNILVTHTPPQGYQDITLRGRSVGCPHLRTKIDIIRPRVSVFGHIHEAYGYSYSPENDTLFVNACTSNVRYRPVQLPIIFDI
ncbi:Metallo-dependent phosphatase-like protein [Phycomyces nitens]|nr:Metallo-dependent phosphatase-like protein [Phycomyces nitens]